MTPRIEDMSDNELRAELRGRLGKRSGERWKWIKHNDRVIRNLAFASDGAAHADGVPERVALEAMVAAHRRAADRRSASATRAAATRARRQELQVAKLVAAFTRGGMLTPSAKCRLCGRNLDDEASRARGIGSECWQGVLRAIEVANADERAEQS